MSDRPGSLAFAARFALLFAARAAAQPTRPIVASAPAAPELLTRYDSHLSIASPMPSMSAPIRSTGSCRIRGCWDSAW
jgi:hypothetical protein